MLQKYFKKEQHYLQQKTIKKKRDPTLNKKKILFFENVPVVDILSLEFPLCLLDQTVF